MDTRVLAAMAIGALCLGGSLSTQAQTTQMRGFDSCRSEGVARGIRGEALATFVEGCMKEPMSGAASAPSFQSCRSEAIGRGLSGDARAQHIDSCLNVTDVSQPASGAPENTYTVCRSRAVAQRIEGQALDEFLDNCVTR
jgi:hypothetical protein